MFQDCIKYLLHLPPPKFTDENVSISIILKLLKGYVFLACTGKPAEIKM